MAKLIEAASEDSLTLVTSYYSQLHLVSALLNRGCWRWNSHNWCCFVLFEKLHSLVLCIMAAIPGLGGGLTPQDMNVTGDDPRHGFKCSDEMKASAVLLTSLGSWPNNWVKVCLWLVTYLLFFLFLFTLFICLMRYCLDNTFPQEVLALQPIYYLC